MAKSRLAGSSGRYSAMPTLAVTVALAEPSGTGSARQRDDFLRHGGGGIGVFQVRQHHRELVAPQPRGEYRSPARTVAGAIGHLPEQLVARVVPERVVHLLEPVQIHQQDGQQPPAAPGLLQALAQVLEQQVAVGQAGQIAS
jgi:hypothetical protein